MLKHDSSGFLVGEVIDPLEFAAAIDLLEQIRDDLAAIKGVVSNPGSTETGVGYASPVAASSAIGLEKVLVDVSAELLHPRPQSVATPNYISSVSNTFAESASNQVALPIPLRDKSPVLQGGLNPAAVRLEAVVLPNAQARGESAHALRERDASGRLIGKRGGASENDGAISVAQAHAQRVATPGRGEAQALRIERALKDTTIKNAETVQLVELTSSKQSSRALASVLSPSIEVAIPARPMGGVDPRYSAASKTARKSSSAASSAERERDASGRFIGKRGGDSGNNGAESISDSFSSADTAKRIGEAVAEATGGADEVDPTIKAFNEIAAPVGKVVGVVRSSGRREEKERRFWFRRIWRELFSFRKEETAYSRASIRVLKDIEKKPESSGGGPLSMFFSLLSKIPLIGGLVAGGALGGAMGGVGGILGGLAAGGKGLLKRIPLLGAILSSAGGLFDIYDSETDANLSRQEKDVRTGKGAGKLAGSLGGLWAGAKLGAAMGAVGGPIGAAIGGVVGGAAGVFFGDKAGKVIGETAGGWVAELRSADPVGYIKEKWESVTSKVSFIWESATTSIRERWGAATTAFTNTFNAVMTSIFGEKWLAIADGISEKWSSIADGISTKWDALTKKIGDKWSEAIDGIKGFFSGAAEKAKEALSGANDYIKDKTGVDVAGAAGAVRQKASGAVEWVGSKASSATSWLKEGWQGLTGSASNSGASSGAKLPKRYRGRQQFDGIAGGAGMSKHGTYTDSEAQRIRDLKQSGANTSANLQGGMPADIQQKIRVSAEAHGLDPEMMLSIAAMESGGNPNAISSTGAIGVYQFVGKTATNIGIKDRFDVDQNIDGAMRLTLQNAAVLEKHGLPLTPENIYMAHQLGPSAAIDLIRGSQAGKSVGDLKSSTRSGMGFNYGSSSSSASEYLAKNRQALMARYERVVANSDAGILPTATVLADAGAVDPSKGTAVAVNQSVASSTDSSLGVVNQGLLAPTVAPISHNAAANPSFFAQAFVAPVQPAVTAYMPTVKAPSAVVAAPPPVEAAPPMRTQLSSGRKDVQQLTVAAPDAGQDVRDRTIAHIVTGGLSG